MGKNFCKVEWKWCKHLKHNGVCAYCGNEICGLTICPRIKEIETTRFHEVLKAVEFENVFPFICQFPDQEKNREGYENVFNTIRAMTPKRHRLTDLYIDVEKWSDGTLDVCGNDIISSKNQHYAIEFVPWVDWVSMFITKRTLDSLSYEEIVAACLFEMTFFGFEESDIQAQEDKLEKAFEELKEKTAK